jgi:hypothetical protein
MFSWLNKAYEGVKQTLGKVKSGIEGGAKLFDKGKETYSKVKSMVSNIPVVGAIANEMIGKAETQANAYAKKQTGLSLQDIDKGVSTAKKATSYLPNM